jgi:amino acid adenylation domain-containing protein
MSEILGGRFDAVARRLDLLKSLLEQELDVRDEEGFSPWPVEGDGTLSFGEERLWFLDRLSPDNPAYNLAFGIRIHGELDPAALASSLASVAARHEPLRCSYAERDGGPGRAVAPPAPVPLPAVDIVGEEEALRLALAEAARPFDLASGPLLRAQLMRTGERSHLLLVVLHHIIADGWSVGVFLRELASSYAIGAGEAVLLPRLVVSYGDFASWQRRRLSGPALEERIAHWRQRLAGCAPVLELPTGRPRPPAQSYRGGAVVLPLPTRTAAAVQTLSVRLGASPFMILLAVFKTMLLRLCGREDVVVGSPVAGRERPELEDLVGFFVNMLVLRTDLSGNPRFHEAVQRVRETVLDALAHQDLPFEALVAALEPERDPSRHPLYQVSFTHRQESPPFQLGGLSWALVDLEIDTAKWDLMVEMVEAPEGWRTRFRYDRDLFDVSTVTRLAGCFHALLAAAVERPDAPLSDLPLLSAEEHRQVLTEWNDTAAPYPRDLAIPDLFVEQAARIPDAVAVTGGGESLTYCELDRRANRLARRLRGLGVGPEAPVVLLVERSVEAVVAILAVLKAGGAYVPLDPELPEDRLLWLLGDVNPAVVLAQDRLLPKLRRIGVSSLLLMLDRESFETESAETFASGAGPSNLAYVLFTSGSTGQPKGVCVTHHNVVRLVRGADYADLGPREVFLQFAPLAFDASTLEIWGPLLNGGRLVVCPPGHRSLEELGRLIQAEGVTSLWLTAGLFHQMVDQRLESLQGVRQLLAGGDVLSPAHVRRALAGLPGVRLVNGYGPTEGTTFTCSYALAPGESVDDPVPLGRPIANTRAFVLDHGLQPMPPGLAGELFAAGDGVARGYLGRPDLTAERFIPDPFSREPGARLYRTDDLVRQRGDGVFEFLGRLDGQVKIRGFRIELGEVEAALTRRPGVRQAAVIARSNGQGEKRLVAYLVPDDTAHDVAGLRADLKRELPEYMVPVAFVTLESLPLTRSGKVDRRALPEPDYGEPARGFVAPSGPVEEILAHLWTEVMGIDRVGAESDFFELGGHSLLAMRIMARMRDLFQTELPLRAFFDFPTVRGLAAEVERFLRRGDDSALAPLASAPGAPVASFAQERLWFLEQLEGGGPVYNIAAGLRLSGRLDGAALAAALGEIVRRHQVLRTAFEPGEAGPVPRVLPPELRLPVIDLGALPADAATTEARRLGAEEARRRFDLSRGPVLRATLLRLAPEEHQLHLTVHHISADGWSMEILFHELAALYEAFTAAWPSPLPDPSVQYADFAAWQRERLQGGALAEQLAWWCERLAGLPPVLELPTDRPRPPCQSFHGGRESIVLDGETADAVRALSRRHGGTLFLTLLAAFQALLSRYTSSFDIAVGTPIAHRDRSEVQGLIGLFVNTLVHRLDLGGDPDFAELLGRVRRTVLEAFARQDLPFEKLIEELRPQRDLAHAPLFQIMFLLQQPISTRLRLPGIDAAPLEMETGVSKFDLTLAAEETAAGLTVTASYRRDLFDGVTIARLLGHFQILLTGAVTDPSLRLSELPLLTRDERCRLQREWNDTGIDETPVCLHELFAAQVARTPTAAALVCGDERLSYAELDRRAGRLARQLLELGVGPEVLVGVCLDRSVEMVVALLATLRAGGAYVPLDPTYPRERLAWILADARAPVVLTREQLADDLGLRRDGVRVVCLEHGERTGEGYGLRRLQEASGVRPENLAYVIYTSGSTGRPKGVAIEHRGASVLISWARRVFTPEDLRGVFAATSICFDLSVFELFVPLSRGGTAILADNALALAESPPPGEVTLVNTVPSAMSELVRLGAVPSSVRVVNLAGEPLRGELVDRIYASTSAERVLNLYGPSEDTTYSTWTEVPRRRAGEPTIGGPLAGKRAYLLDRGLHPLPVGVPGELYLSGAGLARGYLGRPELTAERFVPDPLSAAPGGRMYRTGDLARWRSDGEIDFLGRLDHQVKVRGFRVELGEIEAALLRQAGVREAVVVAREEAPGDKRLVAYVAPSELPVEELRSALSRELPEWMVPSTFVVLATMPLTPNGKVDRKALPVPEAERGSQEHRLPAAPVEELLAGIWSEVLGAGRVGLGDGFFALGGHSLKAMQVVSRVRSALGVELPVRSLFEAPRLEDLARRVEAALRGGETSAAPPLTPAPRDHELPLSFAQERLWFLEQLEPGGSAYTIPLALSLRGELDVAALAAALRGIVERHEALRTTFGLVGSKPVQVIAEPAPQPLPLVDLSILPEETREWEAGHLASKETERPFDLARGPLLRTALMRLSERKHLLLLSLHHIAADGWSLGILLDELGELYAAHRGNRSASLPALPVQYVDFAVWQRGWLQGDVLERQITYWRKRLDGLPPVLELPSDRPRSAAPSQHGRVEWLGVPQDLARQVRTLARREGVTAFMLLLAAFQGQLSRETGRDDLAVGTPVAGRTVREIEGLIGFFVNTLVLRGDLSGDPSFRDLLGRMRETALEAYAHQDLPFEKLVEEIQPERHLGYTPLFQVMFLLQNAATGSPELPGLTTARVEVKRASSKFDLSLAILEGESDGLRLAATYRTDLFDRATITRALRHFRNLLEGAAAASERRLSTLPLLTEAERAQLREWNDTGSAEVPWPPFHLLVEEQAARRPDAVAAMAEEESITYGELDRRSNQLAHFLQRLGVGPEVVVGLHMERSLGVLIGMLGIVKAGGAYSPLDPALPSERLAFVLADTGAPVLLTQERLVSRLPARAPRIVRLDTDWPSIATESDERPGSAGGPENLAYVIYTSGSTGTPKGVAVEHRQLSSYLRAVFHRLDLASCHSFATVSTFAADLGHTVIFPSLCSGGCLHVLSQDRASDPMALAEYFDRHPVDCLKIVPSHLAALRAAPAGERIAPRLRLVLGGEASTWADVDCLHATSPGCIVYNHYGPTETTVGVITCRIAPGGGSRRSATLPLGRPLANSWIRLLDAGFEPVPSGVPGELYIGGHGVARGYLGRPDLTAERFVPDPFGIAGERLYRTGDLGRWLPEGAIEFLGRLDHQVKVRGFRIELGEIETVLLRQSGVREAAVLAREDDAGDRRLVAYVTPAGLSAAELRMALARELPDFMVPSAFVSLDALPLSPNGKLDRKALPAPRHSREGEEHRPPRTPLEEMLAGIWAEVLGVDRVGLGDSFFELGGHSLKAIQVVARLRSALGIELPLQPLFEAPRLEDLVRHVGAALGQGQPAPALGPIRRDSDLPLSFAQERLWFLDRLDPESPTYNLPVAWRLKGELSVPALHTAFAEVVRRHEALRTVFDDSPGTPIQVVLPPAGPSLPVVDLRGLPEPQRLSEARRLTAVEGRRPFDLRRGPLMRPILLAAGEREHVLIVGMHHIVSDGWSMGVLRTELAVLYGSVLTGHPASLPDLPVQYPDYAVRQREWLCGEALERLLGYWRDRLTGAATLELPTDRPRPAVRSPRGGRIGFRVLAATVQPLIARGRGAGATPFMVLLATFQTLLHRLTGEEDVVVGTPVAGRDRVELEPLIGFFVNILPLRCRLSGELRFLDLLGRVREATLQAYAHQDLPFEKLVEELQPVRDLARTPLFQVSFIFQNTPRAPVEMPGLSRTPVPVETGTAKLDLALAVTEEASGLAGLVEYDLVLFDAATMHRFAGHFVSLLTAVAADAGRSLSSLPLLSSMERRQILVDWNATAAEIPAAQLHEPFEAQTESSPETVAAVCGSEVLTYAELNCRANRLAHHLRRLGVGPEVPVGLCAERSPEMLVGLLAVLKSGGFYVPLDPAYPRERLAYVLEDAGAPVLLTQSHLRRVLPEARRARVIELDAADVWAGESAGDPEPLAEAENPAYAIYTSGSTGRPKGVQVRHRGAVNFLAAMARRPGLGSGDVLLAVTTLSFDIALLELLLPLWTGARVVIASREEAVDGARLAELLASSQATVMQATPATWRMLLEAGWQGRAELRAFCGGEALPRDLAERLLARVRQVWNLYGPTETTVWSAVHPLAPGAGAVPVGRPIANTEIYVLDGACEPAPVGVPGELWIGGDGLARGYLGRPDLTADRFVPDPFGRPGGRLYRTGDLARWLPGGELEFLGRLDHQVKIRGFRIEPGEIEAVLERHPEVAQSVVVAREDAPGDQRLVAYMVARPEAPPAAAELREWLRGELPQYMLPAAFVVLEKLPLTPNGKVDRKALPAPDPAQAAPAPDYVAPRTSTERLICSVWQEVLGMEKVGLRHNFFDLGGHSLLLVRVLGRLRAELSRSDLTLVHLFNYPDVDSLARFLTGQDEGAAVREARGRARQQLEGRSRRREFLSKIKELSRP